MKIVSWILFTLRYESRTLKYLPAIWFDLMSKTNVNERFCYKFYFVRQFQIPDTLIAWPFSCFTLLGASLKIDTFPLCELTIINYYWTNSEQELWKMRQKTACPGSESDILMPFWQTRERERIQNKLQTLAPTICRRRLWINILQRIILCIIWLRPCYIL